MIVEIAAAVIVIAIAILMCMLCAASVEKKDDE